MAEIDHIVIHIDDWELCNAFYRSVVGVEIIDNPEGAGNPLGSVVYRVGAQQINVHGPWPGKLEPCCAEPLNLVGGTDLAFRTERATHETLRLLDSLGIDVIEGPVPRFGARGWGSSVYCTDPSGNGVELITYQPEP